MAAAPRDESAKAFDRTVTLPAGRAVRVEHQFGRVQVRGHARNEVQIHASIRASAPTADEARRRANEVEILVEENSSGVTVRTRYPSNWPRNVSYAADYEIVMPEAAGLDIRNRFGAVDVAGLKSASTIHSGNGGVMLTGGRGRQRVDNSFGLVEVRNADGDVFISNGNGRVIASDINGAVEITNRFETTRVTNVTRSVTVNSNNGEVSVENPGGPVNVSTSFNRVGVQDAKGDVHVRNQNGVVTATNIVGSADLHTTFGAINFSKIGRGLTAEAQNSAIRGDTVGESAIIETTFGSVDVRDVKGGARVTTGNSPVKLTGVGGETNVKASFGVVTLAEVSGAVTVEDQNGSVIVSLKAGGGCHPVSLRTSFGAMNVTVPRGIGYNLAARTSFGRIHADSGAQVTVSGEVGNDSLTGRIGSGGCDLRLNNQNGGINIFTR